VSETEHNAVYPAAELQLIRCFMDEHGIPMRSWLLGTGLADDCLDDTELRLSNRQFDIVHRNIARLLKQLPDAGLRLGVALNLSRWGMMAGALLCSRTLGEALATANRYRVLVRSRFQLRADVHDDLCIVRVAPVTGDLPVNLRFSLEVMIASLSAQIEQLLGKPFSFQRVEVPLSAESAGEWRRHLGANVHFSCKQTRLIFPAELLSSPLPFANPVTRAQILAACESEVQRLASARSGDVTWRVREWLSGQEGRPSMSTAAAALNTSERTLRRQLQLSGTSYTQLLDEHCLQSAMQRLLVPGARVTDVARQCGYRDIASFREAFRRYSGMTPGKYQRLEWQKMTAGGSLAAPE
jgi:AraC-like DNA-binding protein